MASGLANFFLIVLLVFPIVQPQTPAGEHASDQEKNAREDRDKKVLALVDQIIDGARLLNLPENRVRIEIALAETLWARDEKRARLLFNDAVAGFSEISRMADSGEWENSNLDQFELRSLAHHGVTAIAAHHEICVNLHGLPFIRASVSAM